MYPLVDVKMENPINRVEINIPLCLIISGTLIVTLALFSNGTNETVRIGVIQSGTTAIGGGAGMASANRKGKKDNDSIS